MALSDIFKNQMEPGTTPEDKKMAGWIKSKVEEVRKQGSRVASEGIWMTNIAYLVGYDNVFYDTSTRQFRVTNRANRPLSRNRLHVNRILPTIQNRLSRLTKNRPQYTVRPNSMEQDDKEAASLSEQILNWHWHEQQMSDKQIELYMWLQQCGHAYLKVNWDSQLGRLISDPMTGEHEYEGEVRVDVVSPFEVFPDPLAKNLRDAQWLIQAKVRKIDYFKTHYENGNLVKPEETWLLSAQYEERINSMSTQGPAQSGRATNNQNTAIELIYYERRSKKHPNGRMVISANGVLLEDKELPVGEIPFVKFDDIVIAGKYYSEAVITHLRPIQDQYNRTITKRAEWTNKMLAGKYLTARGSELVAEALNDRSGEVVEYTPVPNAPPPTAMATPSIPSYAYKEEEQLKSQFDEISGINEVSRGQAPGGGITAAIALQYLSEQDDTRIGIMSRKNELAYARVGKLILMYVHEFYKNPRLLKIAGQNRDYMVKEFVGSDIRGNTDVQVVEGSTLPSSETAKRDFILTLRREGLLGSPQDQKANERVLELLQFGDVDGLWDDYSVDMNQIQESIEMIEKEIVPEISELDNNALHVQVKNRYRKTDKFKKLTAVSQQILLDDINQRIDLMVNQANPGLAEAPQIGPVGGPPGEPVLPGTDEMIQREEQVIEDLQETEGI